MKGKSRKIQARTHEALHEGGDNGPTSVRPSTERVEMATTRRGGHRQPSTISSDQTHEQVPCQLGTLGLRAFWALVNAHLWLINLKTRGESAADAGFRPESPIKPAVPLLARLR